MSILTAGDFPQDFGPMASVKIDFPMGELPNQHDSYPFGRQNEIDHRVR